MVAGVVLVVAGGVWIGQNRPAPSALTVAISAAASSTAPTSTAPTSTAPTSAAAPSTAETSIAPTSTSVTGVAAVSTAAVNTTATGAAAAGTAATSSTPAAAPVDPAPAGARGTPVRLEIPVLAVSAPVDPVLTDGNRVLHPPDDPGRVGWWLASAPPGADGPTVLVGHVDSATAGAGALLRMTELGRGDRIVVDLAPEGTAAFAVTGREIYDKADGLPADLFSLDGPPRLVVITCGGPFDAATGNYEDNVVVFADPVT